VTSPDPNPPEVPVETSQALPDEGGAGAIRETRSAAAPEPSPIPLFGQNATWLARTIESGEVTPTFVEAGPPPASPWEEGVERPALSADVPAVSAAVVDDTVPTPQTQKVQARGMLIGDGGSPVGFVGSFATVEPEFLVSTPSPTANPAQSPMAVDVSSAPVVEVFVP
jgi:hypothetical protein